MPAQSLLRRRRTTSRRGPGRLVTAVLLGLAVLLVVAGCGGDDGGGRRTAPSAKPTPIGQLNTTAMDLARVEFCPLIPTAAVEAALGGGSGHGVAWGNGDSTEVAPGVSDVVHEFGCGWSRTGYAAQAWVYARAVTEEQARAVVAKTSRRPGCRSVPGPGFGSPSQRQRCTLPDGSRRVRDAGLFGDTWLTCQVSGPATEAATDLDDRADAWCVQVANALNTTR